MRKTPFDAAVVGRGPVGAAAALALARAGLRTALVGARPKAPRPRTGDDWDSRIYALSPGSRTLLETLKAWGAMDEDRIAPVYDMRVRNAARGDELHLSAYEAGIETLAWIVEHREIARALEGALGFSEVQAFEGTASRVTVEDTAATVRLDSGDALRARLVVGADGSDSMVRASMGFVTRETPYGQQGVVANFRCERSHLDCAWQWFRDDGILAVLPLPPGLGDTGERFWRFSIVWSAPNAHAESLLALEPAALAGRVREAVHDRFGALEPLTPARAFALRLITVDPIADERIALVGDAAHVVHPLAGHGMNLGFGDVADLARVLAEREPERDPGDPLLLRRYVRARAEPVTAMRLTTDGLFRLFYRSPPPVVALRDIGWRFVQNSRWLKRQLIAQAVR
ncbi:MAG: FAD-dependent monooxygenase [Burkholderiales bacterium]|nr:MAG: FAD-dependent monooxygenase [Burkholderiales bacterium]